MRTSTLFGAKNFGFFEIYGVSAWTRGEGVKPVRTFTDKGGGGQFLVILGRCLLWTTLCYLFTDVKHFYVV